VTGKQVSAEQVKTVMLFVAEPELWFDSNTVAQKTQLPGSTVRHFLLTLLSLGILERVNVYGGYRYRLSPTAEAQPYFARVQEAAAVMQT